MKKQHFYLGLFLSLLTTSLVLCWDNWTIVKNLNTTATRDSSDGIKNYYTFAYHIVHGKSFNHFDGLNYPYGEQVVFTDNQPLFANILQWTHQHLFPIGNYSIAIVNLLLFLSFLTCTLFLYLIFVRLKLPWWYAAFFAIILTLMAPQMARFNGHFALSYACFIPMLVYGLLHFNEKRKVVISLVIGGTIVAFGLLHLYYLAIGGFLLSFYHLFFTLGQLRSPAPLVSSASLGEDKKGILPLVRRLQLPSSILHFSIQVVLPFAIILLWLNWTDTVTDRPQSPNGFLYYIAQWKSILLPINYPLAKWINTYIGKIGMVQPEGIAYLGLMSALTFVGLSIRYIVNIVVNIFSRKRHLGFIPYNKNPFVECLFWVGLCAALFACGVPFIFGLESLVDYLGPLKQFRSIGRFAWITYFLVNIAFVYLFYQIVQNTKIIWLKYVLLFFLIAVPSYEAQSLLSRDYYWPAEIKELATEKKAAQAWSKAIDPNDYQAILPFPYFHIGSENFVFADKENQLRRVLLASLQSGLPVAACHLSRTSQSQTHKSIQWVLKPLGNFDYLNDLSDERPFLIWHEKAHLLKGPQRDYKNLAKNPVFENEDYALYRLNIKDIKNYSQSQQEKRFAPFKEMLATSMINEGNSFLEDYFSYSIKNSYEENEQVNPINQSKGRTVSRQNKLLFEGFLKSEAPNQFLSYWIKIDQDKVPRFSSIIEEYDKDTKQHLQHIEVSIDQTVVALDQGWALVEQPFSPKKSDSRFVMYIEPREVETPFFVDELLIRPTETKIFWEQGNYWVNNNWWQKK